MAELHHFFAVKATNSSTTSDLDIIYMTGAERQFDVALLRKLNVSDTAECVNVGLVSEGNICTPAKEVLRGK